MCWADLGPGADLQVRESGPRWLHPVGVVSHDGSCRLEPWRDGILSTGTPVQSSAVRDDPSVAAVSWSIDGTMLRVRHLRCARSMLQPLRGGGLVRVSGLRRRSTGRLGQRVQGDAGSFRGPRSMYDERSGPRLASMAVAQPCLRACRGSSCNDHRERRDHGAAPRCGRPMER
jgi:hypothetical protein